MNKFRLGLFAICFIALTTGSSLAQTSLAPCVTNTSTILGIPAGTSCNPVTSSNPLPVGVYGGSSATAGYVLTSNGPSVLATFQPASGGGSGTVSSFAFTNANGASGNVETATTTPNLTLTPTAGGIFASSLNNLGFFTSTTSAQLAGVISDETGTGALVFAGSPTFTGTISAANASLSGTTTTANLTVTGTCIGCSSSGTINSGLANQIAYYAADGTAISGHAMLSTTTAGIAINGFNGIRVPDLGLDVTSIAVGRAALASYATTTGSNVAVGYNALNASTTSTSSVAVGAMALSKETIVGSEVAIGAGALQNSLQTITTAGNVAIGFNAMNATITSAGNTAVGYLALQNQIGGGNAVNVALGYKSLSGALTTAAIQNVALGDSTMLNLTSGFANTAIGSASMGTGIVTGNSNVAIGRGTLAICTSCSNNMALGHISGNKITTGSSNTIIGDAVASTTLATGGTNILIGTGSNTDTALSTTTSAIGIGASKPGNGDTAIGNGALAATITNNNNNTAVGYNVLTAVTTGKTNTALGFGAGSLITVGTGNTVLGSSVASTVLTIGTNNILIGTNNAITATTSSESNAIHIGGTGGDAVFVTGTNTNTTETMTLHGIVSMPDITQTSSAQTGTLCWASSGVTYDASLGCLTSTKENKERISSFSGGLAEVMKFKPISFYYKDKKMDASEELGLLAEDVKEVEPRLVGYGSDGKLRGVRYEQLTAVLISAIQEQQKEIDALKKQRVK